MGPLGDAADQISRLNLGRGSPKNHLCEIISKLGFGFRKSRCLSQLLMDGRRTKTDHKTSPCHFVTGELKSLGIKNQILRAFRHT